MAGNVIVCGFPGVDPPHEVRAWITNDSLAGVILFKRNIEDVSQATGLIAACAESDEPSRPLLVCVDQEGGRVARFDAPIVTLPPMRRLAAAEDLERTNLAGRVLGRQLRALGINLDFAPVLDIDTNPDNPVIGDRAFGATPETVIEQALAFARGLHTGGVLSCGKHFPGHGDTDLDSHFALPRLRHDRDRLDSVELAPFRAAVGTLPSIMTAHVVFESLDDAPATLSPAVIGGLLRKELGYEDAVFTDDLEMKAVSTKYPVEESGLLAIEAGCDVLLVCSDVSSVERLREALVHESERSAAFREKLRESHRRVERLRGKAARLPAPVPLEIALHHQDAQRLADQLA